MEQKTILKLPDQQDRLLRFLCDNKGKCFNQEQIENLKTGCTRKDFGYLQTNRYIQWDSVGEQSFSILTDGEVYVSEITAKEKEEKRKTRHERIMLLCTIISAACAVAAILISLLQ